MNEQQAIDAIRQEYGRAAASNAKFNSVHEGYAVILEELDELWDIVKLKASKRDPSDLRKEAMQVAAMGLRFMVDLT